MALQMASASGGLELPANIFTSGICVVGVSVAAADRPCTRLRKSNNWQTPIKRIRALVEKFTTSPPRAWPRAPVPHHGLKPRFVFFCPWLRGGNSHRLHSVNILRFVIEKEHSRGFRRMGLVWSALGRFCYPSPSAKRHLSITRTAPFIFFPPFTLLKGGRGGDCGRKVNTNQ